MNCYPDAEVCTTYGTALNFVFEWTDENGAAVDLSDAAITIVGAYPPELSQMTVEPVDLSVGKFRVRSTIVQAQALRMRPWNGNTHQIMNYFRVQALFGPDDNDVTQRIGVEVK